MVPERTMKAWWEQHDAAERARAMAEEATRRRLVEARIRLEKAMRALEFSMSKTTM